MPIQGWKRRHCGGSGGELRCSGPCPLRRSGGGAERCEIETPIRESGEADIRVSAVEWAESLPAPLETRSDRQRRFTVDVAALYERDAPPVELEIAVDHPSFLPGLARVASEGFTEEREVEVELVRAAILAGRVVQQGGAPVGGAVVTTHAVDSAKSESAPTDRTVTHPDGKYRLRARESERIVLLALTSSNAPATAEAAAVAGRITPVPDLIVSTGVAVSGRVTRDGEPVVGAGVAVHALGLDGPVLQVDGERVVLAPAGASRQILRVRTGEDGRYPPVSA